MNVFEQQQSIQGAKEMNFGGVTFDPVIDGDRLTRQLDRVRSVMADGRWRTLAEIAVAVNAPESSVSSRIRDLRKRRFGGLIVERRWRSDLGASEYRVARAQS